MEALALNARDAALDFDGWLGRQPEPTRRGVTDLLSMAPDREWEKRRLTNTIWLSERTGLSLPDVEENYAAVRAGFGEQMGWEDDWKDDTAFHSRIVQEATRERDERWLVEGKEGDDELTASSLVAVSRQAAVDDKPWTEALASWAASATGKPGYSRDRLDEYQKIAREAHEELAAEAAIARPAAEAAWAALEKKDDTGALAAFKPLTSAQRAIAVQMMRAKGEESPGEESGFGDASGKSLTRAIDQLFLGSGRMAYLSDLVRASGRFAEGSRVMADSRSAMQEIQGEAMAVAITRSSAGGGGGGAGYARAVAPKRTLSAEEAARWNAEIEGAIEDAELEEELRGLAQQSVDPIRGGSWVRRKLWLPAVESLPTMAAMLVPGTWAPAIETAARSYQHDEYTRLRGEGVERGEAVRLSAISGGAQAAVDFVGVKWLQKFAPRSARELLRWKVAPGSAVGRFTGRLAVSAAGETGIEQIQDQLIPAAVDDFLSHDPRLDRNWAEVWKDVATTAPDVFLGMLLPTALFAAAGARNDLRAATELMGASEAGLRLAGYSKDAATEIRSAGTPEEVRNLLNRHQPLEAPREAERAEVVNQIVDEARNVQSAAAEQAERERLAFEASGVSLTRRDGRWVVSDGKNEIEAENGMHAMQIAAGMSEVIADYDVAQVDQLAANIEAVEALDASQPEGQKSETALYPEKVVTALDKAADGAESEEAILERQRIFEAQHGLAPGESAGMIVLGENVGAMRDGMYQDLSKINAGATVLDIFEERIEGRMKAALARGLLSREEARGVLELVEQATGDRYLTGDSDTDLIEGVSSLLRAELYRQRKEDGPLAPRGLVTRSLTEAARAQSGASGKGAAKVLSFLRAARAYLAHLVKRAWNLKKARAEGKIGDEVDQFLARLARVEEQAVHNKAVLKAAHITVDQLATRQVKAARNVDLAGFKARVKAEAAAGAANSDAVDPADTWEASRVEESPDADTLTHEQEQLIQGYFDFTEVPKDKQAKGKKAFAAVGFGVVRPGAGRGPESATVAAQRDLAGRAWRGLIQGNATPEEQAAALAAIEQGPVSSILHQFVSREIPSFDIRGAVINSPADFHQLALAVRSPFFESIKVAVLDTKNRVIGSQIVHVGSVNESIAGIREMIAAVVSLAERHKGSQPVGWIVSHNHPSGNPAPSQADLDLTRRLNEAASIAGMPLLDHVVTNGKEYWSFREHGMLASTGAKVQVKAKRGKLDLPTPPTPGSALADWETVPRDQLPMLDSEFKLASMAKVTQTLDPGHAHVIYLGTKLQVMAVERVDLSDMAGHIGRGVGREGATSVMVSLPHKTSLTAGMNWLSPLIQAGRTGGYRVIDAIAFDDNWDFTTARAKGLMEQEASYEGGAEPSTFSVGSADMLENVARAAQARGLPPRQRRAMFEAAREELQALARSIRHNDESAGGFDTRAGIERARLRRIDEIEEKLVGTIEDETGSLLAQPELGKAQAGPLVSTFLQYVPGSPFPRGLLMSRTKAKQAGKQLDGEFDGSAGLPRWLFGGARAPDQAAQEAYEAGLIAAPTPDALWDALRHELAGAEKMRQQMRKVEDRIRAARKQARDEANAWAKEEIKKLPSTQRQMDRRDLLRGLVALDALLLRFPPEVRARVGGFVKLASLSTNEARERYLVGRVARLDAELERFLRREYTAQLRTLLDRARPRKGLPGEKTIGQLGADGHSLMNAVGRAMVMDDAAKQAEMARLDTLIAGGTLSPEQETLAMRERELVNLVGDWSNLVAAARAAAVEAVEDTFDNAWLDWRQRIADKRARRDAARGDLMVATGKLGTPKERQERAERDLGWKGKAKDFFLSLSSFEEVARYVFGNDSATARSMVESERAASNAYEDAVQTTADAVSDLFTRLADGSVLEGEKLRWKLSRPSIDGGDWGRLSEMEVIQALLMWAQEDGQRHMVGYAINQAWVDRVAAGLSSEGREVMRFIQDAYAREYPELNRLYRERHGVNLPRHDNYAPLTVKPVQAKAGEVVEPVSGQAMSGNLLTPGSLRTRSRVAQAEPEFRDALQTLLGHHRQMEHWKAYYDFAVDANAVLGNREVGNAIAAAGGDQARTVLRRWVDLFAQGGNRDAASALAANQVLSRMTGRGARMALVGRLGTLMVQSTQLAAASVEMPTGAYLSRLGRLFAGQLSWRDAMQSDFVRRRFRQAPPIVGQAAEGLRSTKPNAIKHAAERMGTLISGADALFTAGTYAILLDYHRGLARAAGLSGAAAESRARHEAERLTERVAQPTRAGTRSLYENTATHPLARLGWAFASEARQKIALAAWAARDTRTNPRRAVKVAALVWGVGGLMAAILRNAWRDMRDDDDEELFDERNWGLARMGAATLAGPLHGIPGLSDAFESAAGRAFGTHSPEGDIFSSAARGVTATKRLATLDFLDSDEPIEDLMRDVEAVLMAAGLANETAASAASLMHPVRDAVGVASNLVE
ncbi:MAG: JAB domain-containing protein [Verrucomicrobiales bacterium]